MSDCEKNKKHSGDCICDTVRAIKRAQDEVDRHDDCDNGCFDLLGEENCHCHKKRHRHDTVPFFIQNDQGTPFFSVTVRERNSRCDVIITPFFRVSKIKGCCATLELLDPGVDCSAAFSENKLSIFHVFHHDDRCLQLRRTGKCITVDLSCFCSIQCLDPSFVIN